MLHKLKTCMLALSLLIVSSYTIEDFKANKEETSLSRAESSELIETNVKLPGVQSSHPQGRSQSPAGVYVIGNFRTGPQRGRPPANKNRRKQQGQPGQAGNNQNQTRRARPRPNRFQVIQILSNNKNKQTNIRLQNGGGGGGRGRKGNKRNKNNNKGGNPSTPVIAPAETISTSTISPRTTSVRMPILAFDPNFQDI